MEHSAIMLDSQFYIEKKDKKPAFESVKKACEREEWMHSCRTIEDVLYSSTYVALNDKAKNIIAVEYMGGNISDEERLFSLIAPYVREGSYIKMFGEDGEQWKWIFTEGKCKKVTPKSH